jgi:DNA-binding response OmpR family regulator
MPHVLVVDDERVLRTSLTFTLQKHGYQVSTAASGPEALRLVDEVRPDLVVLDVMLPGLDGLEVCRRLRRRTDVPVIMLSARVQEDDRIAGLRLGADDYVTKPFSTRELMARIEAVLRRRAGWARFYAANERRSSTGGAEGQSDPGVPTSLRSGGLRLDYEARLAWRDDQPVSLSPKEFQLLWLLMLHEGRALSREELIASVWGSEFMGDARTLDVHIRWLRAKIEPDPSRPEHIRTVRRYGFRFEQH